MPNGEAHDDHPKSKASRSVKTPLQKEALEAAYSSKSLCHPVRGLCVQFCLNQHQPSSFALQ